VRTAGGLNVADAIAVQAKNDLTTAYSFAAGQACDSDLTGLDLGGLSLTPGVYCFNNTAGLTGTVTLNAQGSANSVFVFKVGSSLTTASSSTVAFINGGHGGRVFWQVTESATLGSSSDFAGTIMALTSITLNTSATINCGRALARNGAVTMDTNVVSINTAGCDSADVSGIPEPSSYLLMTTGLLAGLFAAARARSRSRLAAIARIAQ